MPILSQLLLALIAHHAVHCTARPAGGKKFVYPTASNESIPLFHMSEKQKRDTGLTGGPHYFGDFNLNGNAVNAIVDTGSSDLVINPNAVPSSAYTTTGGSCTEQYSTNNPVSGQIATANYHFAEYEINGQFCLAPIQIGAAVMGLGFYLPTGPTVSGQTGDSPLYQFADHGLSSFAIYLSAETGGGGTWSTNSYDPQYIAPGSGFVSESVTKRATHWSFDLASTYQVGSTTYQLGTDSGFVDSGTLTINVPAAAASQIWSAVGADPSTGAYSNCNPGGAPVTFTSAAGNTFSIPAAIYVIPDGNGGCRNAFRPISAQNQVVFGATFMKAYYTHFDYTNSQLNFAPSTG